MGGGASKKVVPQFTVTIVINGEAVVAIDVCEEATLADARKEILLEFPDLPKEYHFSHNGAAYSIRKENTRTVREFAGSDSRLTLIPIEEKVLNTGDTALEHTENMIDTIDDINIFTNFVVNYLNTDIRLSSLFPAAHAIYIYISSFYFLFIHIYVYYIFTISFSSKRKFLCIYILLKYHASHI